MKYFDVRYLQLWGFSIRGYKCVGRQSKRGSEDKNGLKTSIKFL